MGGVEGDTVTTADPGTLPEATLLTSTTGDGYTAALAVVGPVTKGDPPEAAA